MSYTDAELEAMMTDLESDLPFDCRPVEGEGFVQLSHDIVANLGFAQRFGLGIPLAKKALRDNGIHHRSFCSAGSLWVQLCANRVAAMLRCS